MSSFQQERFDEDSANGIAANGITAAKDGSRTDREGKAADDKVDRITWKDSRNADRTMILGAYLHQYDFSFDDNQQVVTRSANDDVAFGHAGFGYVVSHNTNNLNSPLGKVNLPSKVETTVFLGEHHAIHRVELVYDRDKEPDGFGIQIPVVIEWFVATGRDHPVWAVTWKMGAVTNPQNVNFDDFGMDTRGPYGSLNFDGATVDNQADTNGPRLIGGVAWGDFGLSFTTTDAQFTLNSPWTYNNPNSVCFSQAWTADINAEMGIVQTRVTDKEMGFQDRVLGRERGNTSADMYPDKGDCKNWSEDTRTYVVPCVSGWPYQLMNYDWDPTSPKLPTASTVTKLVAWGSPHGWLGASSFRLFDNSEADGRGDRSYATFIVLGPKFRHNQGKDEAGDVPITIKAVEALNAAIISDVNSGSLVTEVARGPGATQTKNIMNGYNDTYAAHYLRASNGKQVAFTFTPASGTAVKNPIFVVQNYTGELLPKISINNDPIAVNTGADAKAFVSLNRDTAELWVTLNATVDAPTALTVSG